MLKPPSFHDELSHLRSAMVTFTLPILVISFPQQKLVVNHKHMARLANRKSRDLVKRGSRITMRPQGFCPARWASACPLV